MIKFILLTLAAAFTDYQSDTIRALTKKYGPIDAVFIDVCMTQDYAHTDMERRIVSIDARRFDCCPLAFANVVQHELAHCAGRMHNSIPGDIMNYSIRVTPSGSVLEDMPGRPYF